MNNVRDRLIASCVAILLQVGFVILFINSQQFAKSPGERLREITLILTRAQELPKQILPAMRAMAPPIVSVPTVPQIPLLPELPEIASPSNQNIERLGRALFGCQLENYGNLSGEDRIRCPNLSEGANIQEFPDLMGSRSHVEDYARWANAVAHKQSPLALPCYGGLDVICLLRNIAGIADGSASDPESYLRDPERWPTYVDADQFTSDDLNAREKDYDAWNKTHAHTP